MEHKKIDYEKVFNMFCSIAELREELRSPFKQREIYASTDANSMIYMPTSIEWLPFEEQNITNIHGVIPLILHEEIPLDVKKLEDAIKELTPLIDEWKIVYTTCLECGGDGVVICDLAHEHDCIKCKGSGEIPENRLSELKIPDVHTCFSFIGMKEEVGIASKQLIRLISAANELGESVIYKVYGEKKQPHIFKVGLTNIMVMPAIATIDKTVPVPFNFSYKRKTQ